MNVATDPVYEVGEAFVGAGANSAHINTVFGTRLGPVGTAFATALATPSAGHVPFLVVWKPDVPVAPATLFINKAAIANDRHGQLTWGAAQAGVALGVTEYMAGRFPDEVATVPFVLLTAVWVDPAADSDRAVYDNNRDAVRRALDVGRRGIRPTLAHRELAIDRGPWNPYLRLD
ncbi:MAG: formaldehyde-activating enzyme [Actinomycetes bacterium]|jgi:5,6,7,8-tetrahydromethanopterin hydro-lyase